MLSKIGFNRTMLSFVMVLDYPYLALSATLKNRMLKSCLKYVCSPKHCKSHFPGITHNYSYFLIFITQGRKSVTFIALLHFRVEVCKFYVKLSLVLTLEYFGEC